VPSINIVFDVANFVLLPALCIRYIFKSGIFGKRAGAVSHLLKTVVVKPLP